MIKSILIANRGEIALRIIRAGRELGIKMGIVYSREDANSLSCRQADEAFFIDAPKNKNPYLEMDKIIDICLERGYEAIHPGYGFLSENAEFAKKCEGNDINFIGPDSRVIEAAGDKDKTKSIARKLGISVIKEFDPKKLKRKDFPILLKASLGGGGRGIRILSKKSNFEKEYKTVQREAERAFGKGKVLIEKYIPEARHIEVQILCDKHGSVVHLYERECSIQRKMQKVIEEAPSSSLKYKIKRKLFSYAKKLAKELRYTNAGTFEFIVSKDDKSYFLEINPRIQVEHGVTEEITGIDIVKNQIDIASGNKLRFKQSDIKKQGHSIECRVNAEDIDNGFSASSGKLTEVVLPGGKGVRIAGDIYTGKIVYSNYDPLLIKIIVNAKNRKKAIDRMQQALGETIIRGVKTNISLLNAVIRSENFIKSDLSTEFININNSIKIAKGLRNKESDNQVNLKELEFERNAFIAATVFNKLTSEENSQGHKSTWVLKSRLKQ